MPTLTERSLLLRRSRLGSGTLQYLTMAVVLVVLPSLAVIFALPGVRLAHPAFRESIYANLAIGLAGLFVLRQVIGFPGEGRFAYIVPIFGTVFALALTGFLVFRLRYSGIALSTGFVTAVGWSFALLQWTDRVRPRYYVVPTGDLRVMKGTPDVDWVKLEIAQPIPPADSSPIVADLSYDHDPEWERLLAHEAIAGRAVYHAKWLRESLTGQVEIEHLSENSFGSLLPNLVYRKIKRIVDFGVSLAALAVLALPILLVALLVRLESDGPALFRQQRMGYRGVPFRVFKFRTMRHAPSEALADPLHASITQENDSRITRLGKLLRRTRIDELPQLINVVRGEMSLIGPRPEAIPLSEWYERELPFYSYRHIVRPGITGWAQVEQGHVAALDEAHLKLKYDFYYIKNFSGWLDALIAMRTVGIVFSGFGSK